MICYKRGKRKTERKETIETNSERENKITKRMENKDNNEKEEFQRGGKGHQYAGISE